MEVGPLAPVKHFRASGTLLDCPHALYWGACGWRSFPKAAPLAKVEKATSICPGPRMPHRQVDA
jgi:hypothetical protein